MTQDRIINARTPAEACTPGAVTPSDPVGGEGCGRTAHTLKAKGATTPCRECTKPFVATRIGTYLDAGFGNDHCVFELGGPFAVLVATAADGRQHRNESQ